MNGKFWLAVLAATILGFFGGWLIWGIALMDYYDAHTTEGALALQRGDNMIWWAMIVAQISFAFLIAWVLLKTGSTTAAKGAVTAVIINLLIIIGMDLFQYAMFDLFTDIGIIVVDVIVSAVFAAIVGGVVGWILGYGSSASSA